MNEENIALVELYKDAVVEQKKEKKMEMQRFIQKMEQM